MSFSISLSWLLCISKVQEMPSNRKVSYPDMIQQIKARSNPAELCYSKINGIKED
jgi:hypothetical protein